MRTIHRLKPGFVTAKKIPAGWHHDGGGLYLQSDGGKRASWVFRFMLNGTARRLGLGPLPFIGLAKARKLANEARQAVKTGRDPVAEREQKRAEARTVEASLVTFKQAAEQYLKFNSGKWKNEKHKDQWSATLTTYAYPVIGDVAVTDIDTTMVRKILDPIWTTKTETASRVRQRVETVLAYAFVGMNPKPTNPAVWKGHLDKVYPKRTEVQKPKGHAAMEYADIPGLFDELKKRDNVSARALMWTILTAARSGETRGTRASEITNKVWSLTAERMKADRGHRVPLSKQALALVGDQLQGDDLLFPNQKGDELSDAAMLKYLQEDLGQSELTVHGFRSSFKQWAKDSTSFPDELSEVALSHVVGDKAQQAYDRSDALERRRKLMQAWADYCFSGKAAKGETVVPIRKRA